MLRTRRQVQPSNTAASGVTTRHHFSVVVARHIPKAMALPSSSPSKVHDHPPFSKKIKTFNWRLFPQQDRRSMSWATRKTIIAATQSFLTPRLTNTMVPQLVVEHSDKLAKSRDLASNFWRAISRRETTRSNCRTIPTGPHRRMCPTLVRSITSFRPFLFLRKKEI